MSGIINRPLGNGFTRGNQFPLYADTDYSPLQAAPLDAQKVKEWMTRPVRPITDILPSHTITAALPALLATALDLTRLIKILPQILAELSEEDRSSFSDQQVLLKLDARFLRSVAKGIEASPQSISDWITALSPPKISKLSGKVLAYLIPAILNQMGERDKSRICLEIAKKLAPKDFRALANPHYFHVQFAADDVALLSELRNNGRTLQIKPVDATNKLTLLFKEKEWTLDHTHLHFELLPDEDREYEHYTNREEKKLVWKKAAEIHTVFKRTSGKLKNKTKSIAIAFPLIIGAYNPGFQKIFDDSAKEQIEVGKSDRLEAAIDFRGTFMKNFAANQYNLHTWGDIKETTNDFIAGLAFIDVPDPIEVSQEQYDNFHTLFGQLQELPPEKGLDPIDRLADHRPKKVTPE